MCEWNKTGEYEKNEKNGVETTKNKLKKDDGCNEENLMAEQIRKKETGRGRERESKEKINKVWKKVLKWIKKEERDIKKKRRGRSTERRKKRRKRKERERWESVGQDSKRK